MRRLTSLLFILLTLLAPPSWAQTPEPGEDFVKSCSSLYQRKEWDGAIAACSKVIELHPRAPDAYVMRGLMLSQVKANYDGAIADFSKAIELDPQNLLLYRVRAMTMTLKNDWDGALAEYNALIEKTPSGDDYFSRGMVRLAKGDLDEAIRDFSTAIEKNHTPVMAYTLRAHARLKKKDLDGAITDYSVVITRNPTHPDAYGGRGLALLAMGKDIEAEKDFAKLLELAPDRKAILEERIKEVKREREAKR